uniref:Reverse transcriptase domain-containing protein n=1 Tax=Strongyloides stercoralis TaxID=6248 RepID=A0A0K0EA54_STRER
MDNNSELVDVNEGAKYFKKLCGKRKHNLNKGAVSFNQFIKQGKCEASKNKMSITKDTLRLALKLTSSFKATGKDATPGFLYKTVPAMGEFLIETLWESLQSSTIPYKSFCYSNTILIPKTPNASKPEDTRPISLLNHAYKVLMKAYAIVIDQITLGTVFRPKEQCANRSKISGCALANLIDGKLTETSPKVAWVDFQKCFDSVLSVRSKAVIKALGLPKEQELLLLKITKSWYVQVSIGKKKARAFKQHNGLLQGCSLSPLLYICVAGYISFMLNKKCKKIQINNYTNPKENLEYNHIMYMDDAKLLFSNDADLKVGINTLRKAAYTIGLSINIKKSNTLNTKDAIFQPLDKNSTYKYLGIEQREGSDFLKTINKIKTKLTDNINQLYNLEIGEDNRISSIRMLVEPTFRYIGENITILSEKEIGTIIKLLNDIDKEFKKLITSKDGWQTSLTKERFYRWRKCEGKGMPNCTLSFTIGIMSQISMCYKDDKFLQILKNNHIHKPSNPIITLATSLLKVLNIASEIALYNEGINITFYQDNQTSKITLQNSKEMSSWIVNKYQSYLEEGINSKFWGTKRKEYSENLFMPLTSRAYMNLNSKPMVEKTVMAMQENQCYLPNFQSKLHDKITPCRFGCGVEENLTHILQTCEFMKKRTINERHTKICKIIETNLKKENKGDLYVEKSFEFKNVKLHHRRPDMVWYNDSIGYIIEIGVSLPGNMERMYKIKEIKYSMNSMAQVDDKNVDSITQDKNLQRELERTMKIEMTTIPLIFSSTGEVLNKTWTNLKLLFGKKASVICKACQRSAMISSFYILKEHLARKG